MRNVDYYISHLKEEDYDSVVISVNLNGEERPERIMKNGCVGDVGAPFTQINTLNKNFVPVLVGTNDNCYIKFFFVFLRKTKGTPCQYILLQPSTQWSQMRATLGIGSTI